MKGSLFFLFLSKAFLCIASPDPIVFQEMQIHLQDISQTLDNHNFELSLLQEKLQVLKRGVCSGVEARLSALEKNQEALSSDLSRLQTHLSSCQSQLSSLEKSLSSEVGQVKSSLQSMLTLLQKEEGTYVVQAGDSLGKIARKYRLPIKALKEYNQLSSDNIYIGQKLNIPGSLKE